ncbi:hypothetical protein [Thalassotalea sp. G2M2-11]|uniref:hypothetical protein n=1 Tax=Thalassotalea sp. G2M2-11 TaxID=2787627 RepID=UPI0019D30FDF|nr:hypothetical protein [Thalassotalea sp. G2M2-11]
MIIHSPLVLVFLLAYYAYFIEVPPDLWRHQDTDFRRMMGYYSAPFVMFFSISLPVYQWLNYRKIAVNFTEQQIHYNSQIINLEDVNEIYIEHNSLMNASKYVFYQVIPLAHHKLLVIPLFFVPSCQATFTKTLQDYCQRHHIKLVKNRQAASH